MICFKKKYLLFFLYFFSILVFTETSLSKQKTTYTLPNNTYNLFFKNKLITFLVQGSEIVNSKLSLEIISDMQYESKEKLFAEGNVIIQLPKGQLKGDKVIFDKKNAEITMSGNITFIQGEQFFESSFLKYNFKNQKGYLKNLYGVIDTKNIKNDLNIDFEGSEIPQKITSSEREPEVLRYRGSMNFGIKTNIGFKTSDTSFDGSKITKWRFKTDKLTIDKDTFTSNKIDFTNDPFNKPQLLLKSKDFSGELKKDKLKLISKNTWVNLDEKIAFPVGTINMSDKEQISRWGFGRDKANKDGFYIQRSFNSKKVLNDYELKLTPYFLIERALKGNTSSYPAKNHSILSPKVKRDINFSDIFGLKTGLSGRLKNWDLNLSSELSSLNINKLNEASRLSFLLNKSIDLNSNSKKDTFENKTNSSNKSFTNYFNTEIYGAYRKKVLRVFASDEEIYSAKGIRFSNSKSWLFNGTNRNLDISYDIGNFNAKKRELKELTTQTRNFLSARYSTTFPVWEKKNLDETIDFEHQYNSEVINEGLTWNTNINSSLFIYSNNSNQKILSFSTGPQIIIGSHKKRLFDYTKINLLGTTILKDGESPFAFDDVDKTQRVKFNLEQQLLGPLLLNYETFLNLDSSSDQYKKFSKALIGLSIKRRAYSINTYYNSSNDDIGIEFKINNFEYKGNGSRF